MLRIAISVSALAFFAGSAMAEPLNLTDDQMDGVTAGLSLPNGNTVLDDFDTPAPGEFHPNFDRSATANDATFGIRPSGDPGDGFSGSNEGPWSAHFMSPVIDI